MKGRQGSATSAAEGTEFGTKLVMVHRKKSGNKHRFFGFFADTEYTMSQIDC